MRKIIVLFIALLISCQAYSLEAFVSLCKYKSDDGTFDKGSILGLMYPQKYQSSTYYLFELRDGVYVDHGSGASGADYFQTAKANNRAQGEYFLKRSQALKMALKALPFDLMDIPDNYSEITLETNVECKIKIAENT